MRVDCETLWLRRVAGLVLGLALVVSVLPGCSTNPATGRRQFNTLSVEEEIALGEQAEGDFIASNGGLIPDAGIRAHVENLGQQLAAVSERPDLPWEFHVIDSRQINAFALPGGKVFMSRGLMEKMTNEAQLAGVLGHEVGHVTAQHIGQRLTRGKLISGLAIVGGIIGATSDNDWAKALGVGASVGGSVYLLRFSRSNEHESDTLGVRYMTRLGYNPYGQVQVMEILKEAAGDGSSGLFKSFFSTHPLPEERIDDLRDLIAEQYPQAGQPGAFNYGEASFERNILRPLRALPPAKHPSAAPQAESSR